MATSEMITSPVYIHRISKPSVWSLPDPDVDPTGLVDNFLASECQDPEDRYSCYPIHSDDELKLVAFATNATRGGEKNLVGERAFIYFAESDLSQHHIEIIPCAGETYCEMVNQIHFDIRATRDQWRSLLMTLLAKKQKCIHLTKKLMKESLGTFQQHFCRSVVLAGDPCHFQGCGSKLVRLQF